MKKLSVLFLTLSLLLALSACGKKDDTANGPDVPAPPSQEDGQDENPASNLVPKDDEPLLPDPESSEGGSDDQEDLGEEAGGQQEVSASHSDVTLTYAGDNFQLSVQGVEGFYASTFASDDPSVATVDEITGDVTAVAPGIAVISMHVEGNSGQYDFECMVRCVWEDEITEENLLASLPERFDFSSGAGGWRTELKIAADGSFNGLYSDFNAGGEQGAEFWTCRFYGQFSAPIKVNDYTYSMTLESLELVDEPGQETVDSDGTRYITTTPYGLENAEEVLIFLPGAPVSELPEDFVGWTSSFFWSWDEETRDTLPRYGLYNVKEGLGFAGVGQ